MDCCLDFTVAVAQLFHVRAYRTMNINRFVFYFLLTVTVCLTGCFTPMDSPVEVFYSHTNPVEGWKNLQFAKDPNPSPAIDKDYHDFINKSVRGFILDTNYLEDGKGQHAITIQAGRDDTYWTYVLIYDRNDKRIKVKKYISGHYMS